MKKMKWILILGVLIGMLFFTCSCTSTKNYSEIAPTTAINKTSPTLENTKQVSTVLDISMLEKSVTVPEGGFSFSPVKNYQLEINNGIVSMMAPNGDPDIGPIFQIMGMMSDQEMTVDDLLKQLQSGMDVQTDSVSDISIAGEKGLLVAVSGGNAAEDKQGQIILVVVDGRQEFVLMAGSSKADWEEFFPVVEAVISSITFMELTPPPVTSSIPSGNYVYTNRNMIRDLDEKDGIIYAATLGGLVTWRLDTANFMQVVPTKGMGHISANAVTYCEIPEPRILVGTLQGISIFNFNTGQWEQNELFPVESKVNTSSIERLYCDQDNHRLLIGYNGLGILDLITGEFEQYTDKNGLLWNSVTDITVNGTDIWFASGYKGIAKINNGELTIFHKENGMPDEIAHAVEFSKDGTLWVGASSGLMSYKNGVWQLFGIDSPAKLTNINEIEIVSEKSLWIATASLGSGRLCLYDIASGSCIAEHNAPENGPILAFTTDPNSNAIIGTNKGITFFKQESMQPFVTSDPLVSNFVDALTISPNGLLWVGTDSGVQVLDPSNPDQPWTTYQLKDHPNMGGNWASAIAFAPDESAWITMINGSASHYQNGQWQTHKDIYSFNAVVIDSQNQAWFADDSKGIIVLNENGEQVMAFTTANGLPSDNVQALLLDQSGVMWIGTNQGLAKYEDNTMKTVFNKDSKDLPNIYVRSLALNANGNLLVGTFTGVAEFDGKNVNTLVDFLKDGYTEVRLTTLACTSNNEIWIGTDKGLIHGNPELGWSMLTTKNGLLTNYISALTVDTFDTVWVGGGGSNFDGGGLLHIVP